MAKTTVQINNPSAPTAPEPIDLRNPSPGEYFRTTTDGSPHVWRKVHAPPRFLSDFAKERTLCVRVDASGPGNSLFYVEPGHATYRCDKDGNFPEPARPERTAIPLRQVVTGTWCSKQPYPTDPERIFRRDFTAIGEYSNGDVNISAPNGRADALPGDTLVYTFDSTLTISIPE